MNYQAQEAQTPDIPLSRGPVTESRTYHRVMDRVSVLAVRGGDLPVAPPLRRTWLFAGGRVRRQGCPVWPLATCRIPLRKRSLECSRRGYYS